MTSISIRQVEHPKSVEWFKENGFTLVVMAQLVDAVYAYNLRPRSFDAFKTTQHAITLPDPPKQTRLTAPAELKERILKACPDLIARLK